ncbi:MAG: THUMP domain-containing protein [Candidatus Woesearchaeota archaeon]
MDGFVVTHKGAEEIAALEIKEIINSICVREDSVVIFPIKKYEELCKLCYVGQSFEHVCLFIKKGKSQEILDEKISIDFDLNPFFGKSTTFAVRAKNFNDDIITQDAERIIADAITKNKKTKANLENPGVLFFVFINDENYYLGIDFAGRDLSKRDYRIFNPAISIKGSLAYIMVRFAGIKNNDKRTIIDPFSTNGVIGIEAAFFLNKKPIHFYTKEFAFKKLSVMKKFNFEEFFEVFDKKILNKKLKIICSADQFRYVDYIKKNAKLAGMEKIISYSRMDIEWLDTKFEKNSLDNVISVFPCPSKNTDKGILEKKYKEFFYQIDFILKKDGTITGLFLQPDLFIEVAEKNNFKIIKKINIYTGKQAFSLINFRK